MPKNRKPSQNDKTPRKNSYKKYNAMQKKLTQNGKICAKNSHRTAKFAQKNSAAKRRREAFARFIILCYFTILPRFRRCFSGVLLRRFAP
ncbi:MAG TPA: hypothetical protein DIV38_01905 [Clostridiales bacterium]|nr:hypothetical protein [Clostridiales bacterium]